MFFLPLILVPIVLLMALNRLWQTPVRLRSGALRLSEGGGLRLATVLAYVALLAGTVAVLAALVHASFFTADRLAAFLHLAPYLMLYPLLYLVVAWVFYYGLKKIETD
ncbi:hypothetical protein DZC30_20190 [Comamonas testosteroni]|uniref:Transmembrane protein n=1 Tax=Comamonas testosteroni TaxID=285 RepID=A0A373FAJ2_COMTE|nr:hypothetical protein [Comamonas testosteroni]RGE40449.1 hypothetical protein DZC30_20190 [Comamonas testosteroni]